MASIDKKIDNYLSKMIAEQINYLYRFIYRQLDKNKLINKDIKEYSLTKQYESMFTSYIVMSAVKNVTDKGAETDYTRFTKDWLDDVNNFESASIQEVVKKIIEEKKYELEKELLKKLLKEIEVN